MANTVHVGALDPQALILELVPSALVGSMSLVTAATIKVQKPDLTEVTWTATLANQTADFLQVVHLYQAGDVDQIGTYKAIALLVTPDGTIPTEPIVFFAVDEFEVMPDAGCA